MSYYFIFFVHNIKKNELDYFISNITIFLFNLEILVSNIV